MTRVIRTLLNCQSWCRLFSQKTRLKKRDELSRHDKAGNGGNAERVVVWADRRIALFESTMYVVIPKRHAQPSSTQWCRCGRKIARAREKRIRIVSFGAETTTFPNCSPFLYLSLSFSDTLFSDTVFSYPWIMAHGRTILERSRFLWSRGRRSSPQDVHGYTSR